MNRDNKCSWLVLSLSFLNCDCRAASCFQAVCAMHTFVFVFQTLYSCYDQCNYSIINRCYDEKADQVLEAQCEGSTLTERHVVEHVLLINMRDLPCLFPAPE